MRNRSPSAKLAMAGLVALVLMIPLIMVYWLVSDREAQSHVAQRSITAGWGGAQVISGPVLVVPYMRRVTQTEQEDGKSVTRTTLVRDELFLSPARQDVRTELTPQTRSRSIYASVIYQAAMEGESRFVLPDDVERHGVPRDQLQMDQAELRFGVSDPRGLQNDAIVRIGGKTMELRPGKGVASSGGSGFFTFLQWDGAPIDVKWSYGLRGSRNIALVPRGGQTSWQVSSPWPHPSFAGSFLPDESKVSGDGFTARYLVSNLALGQSLVLDDEPGVPVIPAAADYSASDQLAMEQGQSQAASIGLVEPVDLYSQVDRSVKYGFLFIGFTFFAFLMFDIVGGARVSSAEYLLTGAGLILFFVMLLAFAEVIGFALAYVVASVGIIGLLTAYSAAVLASRKRAGFIGVMIAGLYGLIYVLLKLEAFSLVIGSIMLFLALAGMMYATRNVDWSSAGGEDEGTT